MPSAVRKRKCRMANGRVGTHVVIDTNTGRQVSCHLSRRSASIGASIRDRDDKSKSIDELLKDMQKNVSILSKDKLKENPTDVNKKSEEEKVQ